MLHSVINTSWTTSLHRFSWLPSKNGNGSVVQLMCACVLLVFRVGADVDVSIEDVSLSGRVQIVFEMDHLVPFPHMKSVSVTFLEK